MKKYIQVENTEVIAVLNTVGAISPDFIEVDSSISDDELLLLYYFKDSLKYRGGKPSEHHVWDSNNELWAIDLDLLRSLKSTSILNRCQSAIISGFVSYALGDPYHYPSKTTDQQNLAASVLASYDPDNNSDWTTPFWCSDASGQWAFRQHSAAQIREVGRDAKSAILTFQFKNERLQAAITASVTAEEIESVVW